MIGKREITSEKCVWGMSKRENDGKERLVIV